MSQLVESIERLIQQSQLLPVELESLQRDSGRTLQAVEKLGLRAELLEAQAQAEIGGLLGATSSLRGRWSDSLVKLQQGSSRSVEALDLTRKASERVHNEVAAQVTLSVSSADALSQDLTSCGRQLKTAETQQLQAVTQGLSLLEQTWLRLETALTEAHKAAVTLEAGAREALLGERSQTNSLAEQLSRSRTSLESDLNSLLAEGKSIEARFKARMAQLLAEVVVGPADVIERTTDQSLDSGVSRPSQAVVARFTEQAVLYMGQQSARSEGLLLPIGQNLEKQVKRYRQVTALKPMLLAAYYFLQKVGQDSIMTPHLELLFSDV